MARNQSFSVSLNLLTKNFQKGVKTIQTSLNSLKMQFRNFAGALGVGLGFTETIRGMIDSAKKLDKAQTVLKNVSDGIEAYGQNQKFVMDLSKKYNQELTTLMGNYAKFHSAASNAGMSLEEQKHIYESLTRAATYYNLTADETNGVMLAINQMISKGKVSSEELRRQLGERLPGAMNYAAKAMGVTTAELDEMIRDGKVLATELLPLLATQLNSVTANLDTNTIQGAIAKLRNAFTELTSRLNVGDIYKKFLNGVGNGVQYIADNLNSVKRAIISLFAGLSGGSLWNRARSSYEGYFNALNAELDIAKKRFETYSKRLGKYLDREKYIIDFDGFKIDDIRPINQPMDPVLAKDIKATIEGYNSALERSVELEGLAGSKLKQMGTLARKVGVALKGLLTSLAPAVIIAALTAIISKFVEVRKELKRIKNLIADTLEDLELRIKKLGSEEVELDLLQGSLNDTKSYDKDREGIIKRLNEMLGTNFEIADSNDEINKAINERLGLLNKEKRYQETLAEIAEKKARIDELNRKKEQNSKRINELNRGISTAPTRDVKMQRAAVKNNLEDENRRIDLEIAEINKLIPTLEDSIKDLAQTASERKSKLEFPDKPRGGGDDNSLAEQYKEIQEDYNTTLRTLNERKKNQLITEDEYKKELEELTLKTAESILALDDIDENTDEFARSILESAKAFIANAEKEDKVQEALDEYYRESLALADQLDQGLMTQEEYDEALQDLKEQTLKTLLAMGELTGSAEELADMFRRQKTENSNRKAGKIDDPQLGDRDATFDYKKEASDIAEEESERYRKYAEDLKDTINKLNELDSTEEISARIDELSGKLKEATANAETFEQAMKLATVSEDLKSLDMELAEGIWNNFKNIADAADRLTNAVQNVKDTMEDPDATGWEQILSIFNAIIQVVDTIGQSAKLISHMVEVMNKLKAAEQAYQAMQDANTAKDLANAGAQVVASQAEATGAGTAEAAKMPFPYSLLAIAAVVGTIAAVFASLPKFANGGIVQGNSRLGDHNLARVNAGEMILNPQQQATLFSMLNNGGGSRNGGGNVEFRIRGTELVGVLNNYGKKISK